MKQTVIGITGGTGCGKTTALHALEAMGFHIIDCDALYHELLHTDREMLAAIEAVFPGVLLEGKLQRKVLGQRVFSDPAALDRLNRTVWPFVCRAVEQRLRRRQKRHRPFPAERKPPRSMDREFPGLPHKGQAVFGVGRPL